MLTLVSGSEADAFLACEFRHFYAHGERLAPRELPNSINIGNMGHDALERLYAENLSTEITLKSYITTDTLDIETIANVNILIPLLSRYEEFYKNEDAEWEVLAVEREFKWSNFPFKPDLIKRHKHSGEIRVVDHKFLYNMYRPNVVTAMPQLGRYVAALQKLGIDTYSAEYNMISTRKNVKKPFQRYSFNISDRRAQTLIEEQTRITNKIISLRSMPLAVWKNSISRTGSYYNCKNCFYLDLCVTDLDNKPGRKLLVETFYEPNTYGYYSLEVDNNE